MPISVTRPVADVLRVRSVMPPRVRLGPSDGAGGGGAAPAGLFTARLTGIAVASLDQCLRTTSFEFHCQYHWKISMVCKFST